MKEYNKVYNVRLYLDAINGLEKKLKQHGNYSITIKQNDYSNFELRLFKDKSQLFMIVNTIDCLYAMLDGYQRALYDNNIIK